MRNEAMLALRRALAAKEVIQRDAATIKLLAAALGEIVDHSIDAESIATANEALADAAAQLAATQDFITKAADDLA